MDKQLLFTLCLLLALAVFSFTVSKIIRNFRLTRKTEPVSNYGSRFRKMMNVAMGQTTIMRNPVIGFLHAIVFWGFCIILLGSLEMVVDGIFGLERSFSVLGPVYDVFMILGDVFAYLIAIIVVVFLIRRLFLNVKRFEGKEMGAVSHIDAIIALFLILLLMVSLIGINVTYVGIHDELAGSYPLSELMAGLVITSASTKTFILHEISWWSHILLIMIFANILPYSKHFHVFASVPNVFLSKLGPLGYVNNMEDVEKEVKLMLDPNTAFSDAEGDDEVKRFGVKDAEDISWKNYLDALACTECGRCTNACPANITGKALSPRKIIMDVRARMKYKAPQLRKNPEFDDEKALAGDIISFEELWACTTCNACATECPVSIDQPGLIIDMRRYLVMEQAAAPAELNTVFANIENNGAPWQIAQDDRLIWMKKLDENNKVPIMADLLAEGKTPEYLFWIGSAGAYDDRYANVTRAFVTILNRLDIDFAVLGVEESDSGDVARRAGNEMIFQMQAQMNIELLNNYGITKIVTCDPHEYNTLKNEYPDLGGSFDVIHHTAFLEKHLADGKLKLNKSANDFLTTYHDPCYLGRANKEYDAPRTIISASRESFSELPRHKSFALCCGAGGGQMFKEAEKGDKEVYMERTEDVINSGAAELITACPFCMTMLSDGIKYKDMEDSIVNKDIAELVLELMI